MTVNSDTVIAVVGAGAMGSGIAQVAAQAGHQVIVVDSAQAALDRGRAGIAKGLDAQIARGRLTADDRDAVLDRLHWTTDLADIAPAGLAIEAIVENLEVKTGLFTKLAAVVAPDAVLASNTSSLSINAMAAQVDRPERFVGLHFFNPVTAMKLVEVVPGDRTHPGVTGALMALMAQWGKVAVRVRDVPGFIVNRVARPYYGEGFAAWGDGIDPATIDQALTGAGGFRMGPLALADLIGMDINYVVARTVYEAYEGKTRFVPQPSQKALFESGKLGRKTGSGVYDYGADLPEPNYVAPGGKIGAIGVAAMPGALAPIVALAREAGITAATDEALPPESIRAGETVIALGDGRTLTSRDDADVLLDHARDFTQAQTWAITARDDHAAGVVAALADALGRRAVTIADRPGQIVLRTLAQLANAAADAVADDVAAAADIDAAMRYGANHPEGPLEWAARFGHRRLVTALDHIAQEAGEMYRPAPLFAEREVTPA